MLEGNEPFAPVTYDKVEDMGTYLTQESAKVCFGENTDYYLDRMDRANEKMNAVNRFHDSLRNAFMKLSKHMDTSEAMKFYKLCRIFDPRVHGTCQCSLKVTKL